MTHILHVNSSPRGEASESRKLSTELVQALVAAHPGATVIERDLEHQSIPFVTEAFISAMYTREENRTPEQNELLKLSDELIDELYAADIFVFGIPMYNFGVPAIFKAYIDYVARAYKTFIPGSYVGLLENKKAFVIGLYGGSGYEPYADRAEYDALYPAATRTFMDSKEPGKNFDSFNLLVPTLRGVLDFMGVTDVEFINVEGMLADEDAKREIFAHARKKIAELAKA